MQAELVYDIKDNFNNICFKLIIIESNENCYMFYLSQKVLPMAVGGIGMITTANYIARK